jgi:hypothetical protein
MARAQDDIGWRCFMEGMVGKEIRAIQKLYCTQQIADKCREVDGGVDHKTPGGDT